MTLGAKCGLDDSDAIMVLHNLCTRLGIDTLSAGSCVAFAMEAFENGDLNRELAGGLEPRWGDKAVMETLLRQIAAREELGDLLADGVARAAERLGGESRRYAYHSKGLELTGFDPRGVKATGLGYAVSPRGGDFTSVYALPETKWNKDTCRQFFGTEQAADRFAHEGKGKMVRRTAIVSAVLDGLGICKVPALSLIGEFDLKREAELVSLMTGWQVDDNALFTIGERIFNLENLFNLRNSPWQPKDSLPDKFLSSPIDSGPSQGHSVDLDPMLEEFYEAMAWDRTGRPRCSKLQDLEIADLADGTECVPDLLQ
jgi:aldehyde:ferredoxin oxidoreductase